MKFHVDCMNSCKYKRDANSAPSFYLLHGNENFFLDKTRNPEYLVLVVVVLKNGGRGVKKKKSSKLLKCTIFHFMAN